MTIYLKTLSGETIPLDLSPYASIVSEAERALDVKPGYRARLFTEDGELDALSGDADVCEGETLSVLVEPYDFNVDVMEIDRVEDVRENVVFTKYMLEIERGIRTYFYESTLGFLIERDVTFEAFGEIEYDAQNLLPTLEKVLEKLFPEWDEEVREVVLAKM